MKTPFLLLLSGVLACIAQAQDAEPAREQQPANANDPFAVDSNGLFGPSLFIASERAELATATLQIRLEVFELPSLAALSLLDEKDLAQNAALLRQRKRKPGTLRFSMSKSLLQTKKNGVLRG